MPDDPESDGTQSSMPGLEYPDTDSENLDIEDDEAVLAAFAPVATGSQARLWKFLKNEARVWRQHRVDGGGTSR